MPSDLEIGPGVVIPAAELRQSASRSSGPGGQHVNKSATRVTLRWNVRGSGALDERQKDRVCAGLAARLTRAGDLVVHAEASRSRARNLEAAQARMAELIADALEVPRSRRPTRPTAASRGRRREGRFGQRFVARAVSVRAQSHTTACSPLRKNESHN